MARLTRAVLAVLVGGLSIFPVVAVLVTSESRPAAAAYQCRPVAIRDTAADYLEASPVVYADSAGPVGFDLCQITGADWSLRAARPWRSWCAVVGSLAAAWLACVAGGPGPHEVFRARCLPDGSTELVYSFGETSWGRAWDNWLATAGPRYGYLLSTSPSRPDRFSISEMCN